MRAKSFSSASGAVAASVLIAFALSASVSVEANNGQHRRSSPGPSSSAPHHGFHHAPQHHWHSPSFPARPVYAPPLRPYAPPLSVYPAPRLVIPPRVVYAGPAAYGYYGYATPPAYYAPPAPPQVWYFCPDYGQYYPQVNNCPSPWVRVLPDGTTY